jgi:hypothetical protein
MIIWLYAHLLRLYPRSFYARFGAEMLDVFTQAWSHRPPGRAAMLTFCFREFGGLMVSIIVERAQSGPGLRALFRRRLAPLWLFAFSLMIAAPVSLSYWGYLFTPPASAVASVSVVEHVALVRFDSRYTPSIIPLDRVPTASLTDFPPSQILKSLPATLRMDQTLDPALAKHLAAALAREPVELGTSTAEYAREPAINPNGCGENCFQVGVQPQTDGSLLVIFPEMKGQPPVPGMTQRLTPDDAWYYSYMMPAGYVVQGRDAEGKPLVFAAIASGAVGNDHYRYHELVFTPGVDGLALRSRMSYSFDVAGVEGFTFPVLAVCLFVPLLLLWFGFLLVAGLVAFVGRHSARWRSAAS